MIDYVWIITISYLVIVGVMYCIWGSNPQKRWFGLLTIFLALVNGLKLDGLI
jgi:hypothetical protein